MASFNLLAHSGTSGFLRCLKAPEGHVIIGSDFRSLEPHVLAHFSRDPGYLKIYHKDAAPNCIYLYLAAKSHAHRHHFNGIYDPEVGGALAVKLAKDQFADIRQRYKVCVLALAYEGTYRALGSMFRKYGMKVPENELHELVALFKDTFEELRSFRDRLKYEWRQNNGYVITGRGFPLAVPRDKAHKRGGGSDLIAYFTQATGHGYVMRWQYHNSIIRKERNILCKPLIPDRHDAAYWVARPDHAEAVGEMMKEAYNRLNDEIGLDVRLGGDIKVGKSLDGVL
jgi:hypothetical protein